MVKISLFIFLIPIVPTFGITIGPRGDTRPDVTEKILSNAPPAL